MPFTLKFKCGIRLFCAAGRPLENASSTAGRRKLQIEGAVKFGRDWAIPVDATKPEDKRVKSGEYRDWRKRTKINS